MTKFDDDKKSIFLKTIVLIKHLSTEAWNVKPNQLLKKKEEYNCSTSRTIKFLSK